MHLYASNLFFVNSGCQSRCSCNQWFCISRNTGQITLKIVYFHYLTKNFSGSKYPKHLLFSFENRSTGCNVLKCLDAP